MRSSLSRWTTRPRRKAPAASPGPGRSARRDRNAGRAEAYRGRGAVHRPRVASSDGAGLVPPGRCSRAVAHRALGLLAHTPAAGKQRRLVVRVRQAEHPATVAGTVMSSSAQALAERAPVIAGNDTSVQSRPVARTLQMERPRFFTPDLRKSALPGTSLAAAQLAVAQVTSRPGDPACHRRRYTAGT